jgi:hypothetical protein
LEVRVNHGEVLAAVKKMRDAKKVDVDEKKCIDMAYKVKELMLSTEQHPAYPFGEALRFAINEMKIEAPWRKDYSAVMGCYFGSHGGRVAAKNKKVGKLEKPKGQKRFRGSHEVIEEPNGQLAFRM